MNRRQKQKFNFGDVVRVRGYENELFRIASFTSIFYHYPDATYKEYTYELTRIPDEEWLEAVEEEMTLVCTAEQAVKLLDKYQAKKQLLLDAPRQETLSDKINRLLDDHIAFMELYHLLKDEDYKKMAELAFVELKELVSP